MTDSPSISILPPKNPICSSSLGICFSSGLDFGSGILCGGNHYRQPTWHKRHPSAARGNHDMDHAYSYAYVDLPGDGSSYSFMYGDVWILVPTVTLTFFPPTTQIFRDNTSTLQKECNPRQNQNAAFRLVAFHWLRTQFIHLFDTRSNIRKRRNPGFLGAFV